MTPDIDSLKSVLQYFPSSGDLVWKHRHSGNYKTSSSGSESLLRAWNARSAGQDATTLSNNTYLTIQTRGKTFQAHRVAYALYHGHWPVGHIDHIDGDRFNNAIENLRDVTPAENNKNCKRPKNNKTGVVGVSLHKQSGKWIATAGNAGKCVYIGLFPKFEDAVAARKEYESANGFSPRHGSDGEMRFARSLAVKIAPEIIEQEKV